MGYWTRVYMPALLRAAEIKPGQSVLDLATGPGEAALLTADAIARPAPLRPRTPAPGARRCGPARCERDGGDADLPLRVLRRLLASRGIGRAPEWPHAA